MIIKRKITIEIDLKLGSEFQKEIFDRAIHSMMEALRVFVPSKHKNNDINISILEEIPESEIELGKLP